MADIHINLSAAVDGSGTAASPRNVIPSSAAIASAGNVIKFKRGQDATLSFTDAQCESSVAYRYLSGTACRIEAYFNDDGTDDESQPKPIFRVECTSAVARSFFRFNSAGSGWTVKNLVFHDPVCSQVLTCSNGGGEIFVEGVEIYDHLYQYAGAALSLTTVSMVFGSSSPVGKTTVRNCVVDGSNDDNLVLGSSNGLIEYCTFKRPGLGNPTVIGDNISCSLSGAHLIYHVIRFNRFYIEHASPKQCYLHNTSTGVGGGGTTYLYENDFHLNTTSGESAAVAVSVGQTDATGSVYTLYARRNRIYDANIAFFAVNGDVNGRIERNLIVVSKAAPSSATSAVVQIAADVEFVNNTVIHTLGAAANTFQAAMDMNKSGADTASVAKNNHFSGWKIAVRKHQGTAAVEGYNTYTDCTKNVSRRDTDASVSLGTGSAVVADPMLTESYMPKPGSPLLAAGTFIAYSRDINGIRTGRTPSIGAFDRATFRPT